MDPNPPGRRTVLDDPALVLNRSWIPVHVTPVRRALIMVFRGAANVVDTASLQVHDFGGWLGQPSHSRARAIRCPGGRILAPEVVQLRGYDKVPVFEAPFSRASLFRRDDFQCQYCGCRPGASRLTIDHVIPRSRGGRTSWENCVVACAACNAHKGDRDLARIALRLRRRPAAPRWSPHLNLRTSQWLDSWTQFLPRSGRKTRVAAAGG